MNQRKAILVGHTEHLDKAYPPELVTKLRTRLDLSNIKVSGSGWTENPECLRDVEIILGTWGMPVLTSEFLAAAPALGAIFYAAGDTRCFFTEEARERGVIVCSAAEANAIPVAEYTLGVICLSFKRLWAQVKMTRENRVFSHELPVPGAFGSKVGLVGLGAIGRRVARHLGAFDVDVLANDPGLSAEQAHSLGLRLVSIEQIFRDCDIVSLHVPWLPATEKMIDRRLLEMMKPNATLINTARGAVLDEASLCSVLMRRTDLTAILDVTYPEPPEKSSPLFDIPNIILTPHIAGSMGSEVTRMGRWMVDECFRYLSGEPLEHRVIASEYNEVS